ncbi:remodeling and spacing factor 1 [Toxorhynchites rutilus septentrionalis]|uniref:remodeling and spacing factor 1 n=1 Tax=Toxorhynchites rutilus septentrionalis TaxID=329112 RepID=UPI00247AE729|nr:remodeling and spacing factor 1 [Toxorhynchites rutilus septentrionalis]
MANESVLDKDSCSCIYDPNFAVIYMFLDKFADECGISKPSITELAFMLESNDHVAPALQDIHVKLLRKMKKMVPYGKWENTLAKFVHTYSNQDAWEIERFGYKNAQIAVKLRVLKALVETQFDRNVKFKGHINSIPAEQLRSEPVGRDRFGNIYWCIMDKHCNVRIFRENVDDETWCVVASNRNELEQLIKTLTLSKSNVSFTQDTSEDNSSNSNSSCPGKDDTDRPHVVDNKSCEKNESEDISHNQANCENNDTTLSNNGNEVLDSSPTPLGSPTETSPIDTENDSNYVGDTIEEPLVIITGSGSGSNCEACPIFSEVVEGPTIYVYGLGNGEEVGMGNVKMSDSSTGNSPELKTPKETNLIITSTDASTVTITDNTGLDECDEETKTSLVRNCTDLPPKKKIPKGYFVSSDRKDSQMCNENVHANVTECSQSSDDDFQKKAEVTGTQDEKPILEYENNTLPVEISTLENSIKSIANEGRADSEVTTRENYEICSNGTDAKLESMHENDILIHGETKESDRIDMDTDETNTVSDLILSTEVKNEKVEIPVSACKNHIKTEVRDTNVLHETEKSVDCLRIVSVNECKKKIRKSRKSKTGMVDGLDTSHILIDKTDGSPPVRQSRRIAQQKIREETNRRMIEEKMLREMKAEAMKKKNVEMSQSEDEEYVVHNDDDFENIEYNKIKKKKISDKPWLSSTSESSSESEIDDDYIEPERSEGPPSSYKSDHEFSPESDLENESIIPIKRARTVRGENEYISNENDSCLDHNCQKCGKTDHPEWILLCDSCDRGYHCSCLSPVLFIIPEGEWFCPTCQHDKLIANLQTTLLQHDEYCKQRSSEEMHEKQQKCVKMNYDSDSKSGQVIRNKVGLKLFVEDSDSDNYASDKDRTHSSLSSPASRNKSTHGHEDLSELEHDDMSSYRLRRRRQNNLNYRFNEYDDLINSAIHKSAAQDPKWHVTENAAEHIDGIKTEDKKEEEIKSPCKSPVFEKKPKRNKETAKKKKRLNNLDVSSDDDCGSDEDFKQDQSTSDEEDESLSMTEESESSLECLKSNRFRAVSKRKLDMEFIDDDSDKSDYNIRPRNNRTKRILDESDEFDEEDLTESEEIDSEELCNDTETDSSADRKARKRTVIRKNAPKINVPANSRKKQTVSKINSKEEDLKAKEINKESDSDESVTDKMSNTKRRTRGRKLHYILDDDFQSSDDGITPGVQRPDTPPEERERFIQKQEEIKRMLAEKNTAAAKELATPKIIPLSETSDKKQLTLSIVPPQIIENAKELDIDFLKSSKNADSDDFDEDLAVNFPDSDEVNEEDLAKIMEDEDFAQHHLRQSDEELVKSKSLFVDNTIKKKTRDFNSIDPDKITMAEKRNPGIDNVLRIPEKSTLNSRVSGTVEHTTNRFIPGKLGESGNMLPESSLSYYHQLLPLPTSSLLQEMKQQAIPLQDCEDATQFASSLISAPGADIITPPVVHMFSPTALNISIDKIEPLQPKDNAPIMRRRRRKKITPLRGDLYKMMENRACEQSMNPLSSNVDNNVSNNYTLQTCQSSSSSNTYSTAFIGNESKLDQPDTSLANCGDPSNFPRGFTMPPLNEHRIYRAFQNLEPVDRDGPPTEQITDITESIDSDHNVTESTSEFSGLVSYFSSQQNELNA